MLDAVDLIEKLAGPDTTLVPGHGTLVKKQDLLPYRAMLVDILAKVKTLREQGKSLKDVLAANLTAPYDKTTAGRHAAEQGSLHHRGVRRGEGLSAGRRRQADDAEPSVAEARATMRRIIHPVQWAVVPALFALAVAAPATAAGITKETVKIIATRGRTTCSSRFAWDRAGAARHHVARLGP